MDDLGTWPAPLSARGSTPEREFDRQVMDELRSDPEALKAIGGVKGNVLILLVPILAAAVLALAWLQWRASGSAWWLAVIAVVIVVAALVWISRVKAVMSQAHQVLGDHLSGSVGYGVGVIREVELLGAEGSDPEVPDDAADHATVADAEESGHPEESEESGGQDDFSSVGARLTLAVSPVQGVAFTAKTVQRYATLDAMRLAAGQHGPVRYLRRSPETTTAVETRLEPEAVQKIYRGAALN